MNTPIKHTQYTCLTLALAAALTACGGGSSGSGGGSQQASTQNQTPTQNQTAAGKSVTGIFVDSPVQGIDVYVGGNKTGTTNAKGEFSYKAGDTVTFKVGNVTLGTKKDPETITPADLTTDESALNNTLVLLQSLDNDQNPDNGIVIPSSVATNLVTKVDLSQKGSKLDAIQKDLKAQVTQWVDAKKARAHFAGALDKQEPNTEVKSVVDAMVGFWKSGCDKGYAEVSKLTKTGSNTFKVEGVGRDYANSNCTGSYTENKFDGGATKILGTVKSQNGTVVTYSTMKNGVDVVSTATLKDGRFILANGFTNSRTKSLEFTDAPAANTPPANNDNKDNTNTTGAKSVEEAVDMLVGYWKTTCQSASNGSKHYYIKFEKQNDTSIKIVNNLVQRFSTSNCTGSSQTSVNNDGSGGVITVQNPTNNGKTFSDGDGGQLTFNSENKITAVSDVTEVWNRISAKEMPSS